jgi:nucleotide-binding universal stress UspA family protein
MKMAKRILAPVDGSEHNESIVPVVEALGHHAGATVRLLRVFPVPDRVIGTHGGTVAYGDQEMARLTGEGLDELRRIEDALHGVDVESVVRFGDTVEEVLLEADAFDADLIALADRHRSRLRDALSRDVTSRIARASAVPTLILHDGDERPLR